MPGRNAATRIGGTSSTRMPSRKPFTANVSYSCVTFSPASEVRRNRIVSRTRRYGSSNGMPFQFSTMTLDDVPIPSANRPGAAWTMLATVSASVAAPRDCRPEPQRRRPCRRQRQRREGVGAAGLGRPEVRVAERGDLLEPLPVRVQRDAVERHCDAVALRDAHVPSPSVGAAPASLAAAASSSPQSRCSRTIADWLAVASSVPSSAHRCTRPWPNPCSTA